MKQHILVPAELIDEIVDMLLSTRNLFVNQMKELAHSDSAKDRRKFASYYANLLDCMMKFNREDNADNGIQINELKNPKQ